MGNESKADDFPHIKCRQRIRLGRIPVESSEHEKRFQIVFEQMPQKVVGQVAETGGRRLLRQAPGVPPLTFLPVSSFDRCDWKLGGLTLPKQGASYSPGRPS